MAPLPTSRSAGLEAYVAAVREIVDHGRDPASTASLVAEANRALLPPGIELPPACLRRHPTAPYTRNLVHQDPGRRFSVIAILWGPFQETRIHDHLNWCVMNMLRGRCLAVDYDRLDDESQPGHAELAVRAAMILEPGSVAGLTPPPRTNIHKIANALGSTSVSLHTYGDPGERARVFDPAAGRYEIVDLAFHNLEP
jgi:predicted metal-dependent enzyme (double-stranded beta helix superfamily)